MGTFNTYVVKSPIIHLGTTGVSLKKGQVVESDGLIVRVEDKELKVPAFNGAIKAGWLIPSDGKPPSPEHTPSPATEKKYKVLKEEDSEVRPIYRDKVSKEGEPEVRPSRKGVATEIGQQDERVVARIKTSAKGDRIQVGVTDKAVVKGIEESPLKVERVAKATGDVEETTVGDSLEEVLPHAEVAGKFEDFVVEPEVPEPKKKETFKDSEIRRYKAEVLKVVYPGVKYDCSAAWRTRVKVILASCKGDPIMTKAFLSIELPTVVKEVKRRL